MSVSRFLRPIALATLMALFIPASKAQFSEGDNVLGVGVGILGGYSVGLSGSNVSQSPAITLHYDHGMGQLGPGVWSIGGFVGYKTISYDARYLNLYNYDWRYTFFVLGARGTWHYNEWHGSADWDTYGIAMLAYRSVSYSDNTDYGPYGNLGNYSYSGSGIDFGIAVGARYWFSDNISAYGEFGYGLTNLQLGVGFKL